MVKFLKRKGSQTEFWARSTRVTWGFVADADFQIPPPMHAMC